MKMGIEGERKRILKVQILTINLTCLLCINYRKSPYYFPLDVIDDQSRVDGSDSMLINRLVLLDDLFNAKFVAAL